MSDLTEILWKAVLDTGDLGLVLLDSDKRIVFWNKWMAQHTGLPYKDVSGQTLDKIIDQFEGTAFPEAIDNAIKSGELIRLRNPDDGSLFSFPNVLPNTRQEIMDQEVTLWSFASSLGQHCLIQVRDRSEGAERERLLRQQTATMEVLADNYRISEINTRAIVDNALEAIVSLDNRGCIESFNPAAETIFDMQTVAVLGKPLDILMGEPWKVEGEPLSLDNVPDSGLRLEVLGKNSRKGHFHLEVAICRMQMDDHHRYIVTGRDITDRKDSEARIQYLAFNDSLTDLPNRVLFKERMNRAVLSAKRSGKSFALMAIDLDKFKPVNDTYGHHVGDQLLTAVAGRLKAAVRETDTVARLGGDEFAVIATGLKNPQQAEMIAQSIVKVTAQPLFIDGHQFNNHLSIGIAIFPTDANKLEDLMIDADKALYSVKEKGGGGFAFYNPDLENAD
jgi:diguanylate cyclase (GGDEF)-like protein/PAS domain S-box-containing protein